MADLDNIISSHLDNASQKEKMVFFQTLVALAHADGKCDRQELAFISEAAKTQGIADIDVMQPPKLEQLLKNLEVIKDRHLALELIREMCVLSHVDNELSDNETLLIGKVGLKLGLSLEKIEQISNWVIDRIIWMEQAKLIFEE